MRWRLHPCKKRMVVFCAIRAQTIKIVYIIINLVIFIPDTMQVRFEIYSVVTKRAKTNEIKYIAYILGKLIAIVICRDNLY